MLVLPCAGATTAAVVTFGDVGELRPKCGSTLVWAGDGALLERDPVCFIVVTEGRFRCDGELLLLAPLVVF